MTLYQRAFHDTALTRLQPNSNTNPNTAIMESTSSLLAPSEEKIQSGLSCGSNQIERVTPPSPVENTASTEETQAVTTKAENNEAQHQNAVTQESASRTNFTKFSELPTELQLQIWEFATASEAPRNITIEFIDGRDIFAGVKAIYRIPAVLHASRVSREVALESYHLSFADNLRGKPIYLNNKKDKVFHAGYWESRFFEDYETASMEWDFEAMYEMY